MISFVSEVIALAERIAKAKYDPAQVWELYKHLRGVPRLTHDGRISRQVRTRPNKSYNYRQKKQTCKGWCVECGCPIPEMDHLCPDCGYDNTYAILFGLVKKKKENK